MPKKTESTGTGLESYVAKLMGNGSNRTSVTEDEIQVALKDIDVSDEQLTAVYSALRNSGIQIISASGNDDAPMDVDDDDNDTDTDDFDDDDEHDSGSLDDHELKMARQADAALVDNEAEAEAREALNELFASPRYAAYISAPDAAELRELIRRAKDLCLDLLEADRCD